jgi:hypothetical protein
MEEEMEDTTIVQVDPNEPVKNEAQPTTPKPKKTTKKADKPADKPVDAVVVEKAPTVVEEKPIATSETQPLKPEEKPATETQAIKPKPLTMANLKLEIDALTQQVKELAETVASLKSTPVKTITRKAMPNGKCQIRDKVTGKTYKSKNNTYQTMLKAGELKELVDKGVFGTDPAKNNFGWFALQRALPDRFECVHDDPETK